VSWVTGLRLSAQAPSLAVTRYSAKEMYKYFEGVVAKPILSLQDNITDDLTSEITVEDLGLLVRAPVAVIAAVPFVLSAGVWLFMTKVFCFAIESERETLPFFYCRRKFIVAIKPPSQSIIRT
jgi:hypothetical protein